MGNFFTQYVNMFDVLVACRSAIKVRKTAHLSLCNYACIL